jgi:hypothetical protein
VFNGKGKGKTRWTRELGAGSHIDALPWIRRADSANAGMSCHPPPDPLEGFSMKAKEGSIFFAK